MKARKTLPANPWERAMVQQNDRLRAALRALVEDFDSIPEDALLPDEINNNEHWDEARAALGMKRK